MNASAEERAARRRQRLLKDIARLAQRAIFGTASSTYRRCGTQTCGCQKGGALHGPHTYVSYRDREAKRTSGYYVPREAEAEINEGIQAWRELQERLRELAEHNRQRVLHTARRRSGK